MCLVVIGGEIKKSCCKCGGLCKKDRKWAEQMSRITETKNTADVAVLLQTMQSSNDVTEGTNATK